MQKRILAAFDHLHSVRFVDVDAYATILLWSISIIWEVAWLGVHFLCLHMLLNGR